MIPAGVAARDRRRCRRCGGSVCSLSLEDATLRRATPRQAHLPTRLRDRMLISGDKCRASLRVASHVPTKPHCVPSLKFAVPRPGGRPWCGVGANFLKFFPRLGQGGGWGGSRGHPRWLDPSPRPSPARGEGVKMTRQCSLISADYRCNAILGTVHQMAS